jgi:hypothetical protein
MIGSPGSVTLTWKTNSPLDMTGSHRVVLVYSRGAASASDDTFTFTAKISQPTPGGLPIGSEGGMCAGFAGIRCATGLSCVGIPKGGFDLPGTCRKPKACMKTGCSGTVCSDKDVITTCQVSPTDACYVGASCGQQADGSCGFSLTPAQEACINGS